MTRTGPHAVVAQLLRDPQAERPDLAGDALATWVAWARRHRLAPYLAWRANGAAPDVAAALRLSWIEAGALELARARGWRDVLRALVQAGVTPVVFKGLGVAHRHYPSPELRPMGDLDLLIEPGDLDRAVDALRTAGLEHALQAEARSWAVRDGYNVPLVHPSAGLVEIHHRLWPQIPQSFTDHLRARAQPADILGERVRVATDADLFLALAAHFALSDPGSSWLWLLDLALLGRALRPATVVAVRAGMLAHDLQIQVAVAVALLASRWRVVVPGLEPESIDISLRPIEREAVDAVVARADLAPDGGGRRLAIARALAGRPHRDGTGLLAAAWRHLVPGRGAEVLALGTRPGILARVTLAGQRAHGLWRSVRGASR